MRTEAPYDFGDDSGVFTGALGDGGGRDCGTGACEYFNLVDATSEGGGLEIASLGRAASDVARFHVAVFVASVEIWTGFLAFDDGASTGEADMDAGGRC